MDRKRQALWEISARVESVGMPIQAKHTVMAPDVKDAIELGIAMFRDDYETRFDPTMITKVELIGAEG